MKRLFTLLLIFTSVTVLTLSFKPSLNTQAYTQLYYSQIQQLERELTALQHTSISNQPTSVATYQSKLKQARLAMKQVDIWLRYLDPLAQKKINGPLPVEWETEVFEKYEAPYKREGAGLLLAYQQTEETEIDSHEINRLIKEAAFACKSYYHDTITKHLETPDHFFFCNRLFLLNLATIYTTGFECANTDDIIPELTIMVKTVAQIYDAFNQQFPGTPLPDSYLKMYQNTIQFIDNEPKNFDQFNHYEFIRHYINPLFAANQQLIRTYKVVSKNLLDYSISKKATSIFSKNLYFAQNPKGIFNRVDDDKTLDEIKQLGKLLFYDPILSQNNERSCASCHKPEQYFTDTTTTSAERFNHSGKLDRNTPTLLNAAYNHLLMLDGKHYTLVHQGKAVISNPDEMGCDLTEMVAKVLSCKTYKQRLLKLLTYTPEVKTISSEHIVSAITYYYSSFSNTASPFDLAMNNQLELNQNQTTGFNLFMSKAQCATCHFAPQFNGIKPPYVNSEFEVLGVPNDSNYSQLSTDNGRFGVNPANETKNAFRTGTIRNSKHTAPYMHNGVFSNLTQVIQFYNTGGGAAHGLSVSNQTLSSDSLHLTSIEIQQLEQFIETLNEAYQADTKPVSLPISTQKELNKRVAGGLY